jgi:hypothetical protein
MPEVKETSRTIVCPRCGDLIPIVEKRDRPSKSFHYVAKCQRDGEIVLDPDQEKTQATEYAKRMKEMGRAFAREMNSVAQEGRTILDSSYRNLRP